MQPAIVPECVVADPDLRYLVDELLLGGDITQLRPVGGKVVVGYVARIAIGNDEISPSVVVKICERRVPAPIGFGNAGKKADVAKYGIAQ